MTAWQRNDNRWRATSRQYTKIYSLGYRFPAAKKKNENQKLFNMTIIAIILSNDFLCVNNVSCVFIEHCSRSVIVTEVVYGM